MSTEVAVSATGKQRNTVNMDNNTQIFQEWYTVWHFTLYVIKDTDKDIDKCAMYSYFQIFRPLYVETFFLVWPCFGNMMSHCFEREDTKYNTQIEIRTLQDSKK